ncbi:MAG: CHAT domain-containing protein [Cyanobacteria bacterium J06642_11]
MTRTVWYRLSLFCLGLLMTMGVTLGWPKNSTVRAAEPQLTAALTPGKRLYEAGQLTSAANVLESVVNRAAADRLTAAIALGNLALVYGQQGNWTAAQRSLQQSQQRLGNQPTTQKQWSVYAQTLNIEARLQLAQNNATTAFDTWGQAAQAYSNAGDDYRAIRSQIRQARALQAQGFYRRAIHEILSPLAQQLEQTPASNAKVLGLRSLAEALQVADSLNTAKTEATQAVTVATELSDANALAASQLTLANIIYSQAQSFRSRGDEAKAERETQTALNLYQQVIEYSENAEYGFRAQLNQLSIFIDNNRLAPALELWQTIQPQIETLPTSRSGIYARINLAQNLPTLVKSNQANAPKWSTVLNILTTADQQANDLGDQRADAYATGYLGNIYQQMGDYATAKQLTEQALFTAKTVNAADITCRWYEQLGDLQQIQGDNVNAIATYTGAVDTLKTLRTDLLTINPEVLFSFKDSIEPVHRKLVSLLLDNSQTAISQERLTRARSTIESLQVEELNNFLRAACIDAQTVKLEEIEGTDQTAIIYPILLGNRMELLVNLPGERQLHRYSSAIANNGKNAAANVQLEDTIQQLREGIGLQYNSISLRFLEPAQQLYDLILEARANNNHTLAADLNTYQTKTLVFIPDGSLRNIPMAALYNSKTEQFLIEQYQIATTPGLTLLAPKPLPKQQLNALMFGITQEIREFSELPNVQSEVDEICGLITCQPQIDEAFTREQLKQAVQNSSEPIIHLATHGQFSSQLEDTFILAWDQNISVNDFSEWLSDSRDRKNPVELLVLSACETARGDSRASLGLAGMAVRAGARSTMASLWQVSDEATSLMMQEFYNQLAQPGTTKAAALQKAQLTVLKQYPQYQHPYYWAGFIILGNWL